MTQEYRKVNILEEFKDINYIEKIDKFFSENKWELLKTISKEDTKDYYQIYFGKNVQVDNNYEYGFPYLFTREDTKKELLRILNYKILDTRISNFRSIKEHFESFDLHSNIYEYLYFIGITNEKPLISDEDLITLIDKCSEFYSEFLNPIEVGQSLAREIYENNNITLEQVKSISMDDFFSWYNNERCLSLPLEISNKPYKIKIGFDYPSCIKDGSIVIGEGYVYYYNTEEEYNTSSESSIDDFRFKYDIINERIFDVECKNQDSKNYIEKDFDDFIDNIKSNLLSNLEEEIEEDITK